MWNPAVPCVAAGSLTMFVKPWCNDEQPHGDFVTGVALTYVAVALECSRDDPPNLALV